jgi:hypothetical protein
MTTFLDCYSRLIMGWALALRPDDVVQRFDEVADVGDTRKELLAFADWVVTMLAATPMGPAMQGLVSHIATDPGLARVYRERVVQPRLAQLAPVIARGIARGDLRAGTEVRLVHELLAGPIFYRLLLSGAPLDHALGARLVDAILAGFTPAPAAQARPGQTLTTCEPPQPP